MNFRAPVFGGAESPQQERVSVGSSATASVHQNRGGDDVLGDDSKQKEEFYCRSVGRRPRNGSNKGLVLPVGLGLLAGCVLHVAVRAFRRLMRDKHALARQLNEARDTLRQRETQVSTLSEELIVKEKELIAKDGEMKCKEDELRRTVLELEANTEELRRQERRLEQLKGELGVSRSTISMVERELEATKRLLASYQGQLDQAHVLRESKRLNVSHDLTSPGAMGIGSLWSNE